MKTVSDDLFRLIKSLNKSEKGYFKKFAARNAGGTRQNYIILFDAIENMTDYDEEALKKKLRNEAFIKQLAVYKVYLFNLILKSLHHYGIYDNSEARLTELLINAKTLIAKNLYKEASKVLKKAKAMAHKYDKIKFLFEILAAERHIAVLQPEKSSFRTREEIYLQQRDLLERLGNFYEYSWLCDQMTIIVDNEGDFKSGEKAKKIEEIISNEYLSDESKPMGYYARMNFYHTHLVYSGSQNNQEKIFYYLEKNIENAEKNKHFIDENPQNYVFDLINLLLYSSYTKDKKAEEETLAKIKAVRQRLKNKIPRETEIQIFYHAVNVEMIIYERSGEMKKGRILAKQVEKNLADYRNDIPLNMKAILFNNLACFYFIDGDFTASLKQVNSVLNDSALSLRNDMFEFAKIFQLAVHFELGNYDLLEYLTSSVRKYFASSGRGKKKTMEGILLDFFADVLKTNPVNFKQNFDELYFKLNNFRKHSGNSYSEGYFDFITWAESKAKGIPHIEAIKAKNLN